MSVIANTIITTDVAPAITVDVNARIASGIEALQRVLGVSSMTPMAVGSSIKMYKSVVGTVPNQVAEGDEIPLTEVDRTAVISKTLTLKKYRKMTTAEAIQQSGMEAAVYDTDRAVIRYIRSAIRKEFMGMLATGTGTATAGTTLQKTLANLWGAAHTKYPDEDITMVYFINPTDVATYLGTASITTQTAFGFDYVENFMGMGTAIFDPDITAGSVVATPMENINGFYAPVNGELGAQFGLTADESGLVGLVHGNVLGRASVETLLLSAVTFAPEDLSGVFIAGGASS